MMNEFRHAVTPVVQRKPKLGRSEAMLNVVGFRRYSVYLEYVTNEQDLKICMYRPARAEPTSTCKPGRCASGRERSPIFQ